MKRVLVTGAGGFIGKNLMLALGERSDLEPLGYDLGGSESELKEALDQCDVVVHLAGVNRPPDPADFDSGNRSFTAHICDLLHGLGKAPKLLMTSSIQAAQDNPYGLSKRNAELALEEFSAVAGAEVVVLRLPNVFGKWSRPNYNSAVATFCYNAWRGIPLDIHDPDHLIHLVHIDDVIALILSEIDALPGQPGFRYGSEPKGRRTTVGDLARLITGFAEVRASGMLPEVGDAFIHSLYSTYLSFADGEQLAYQLDIRRDERGMLAEFAKSPHAGQIFVSRTKPGVTRGNHYHHCKVEKFLVVEGRARIALRDLADDTLTTFDVDGADLQVVDIPPGCTHSIKNLGSSEAVVLFWASEVFDPTRPDTYSAEVLH